LTPVPSPPEPSASGSGTTSALTTRAKLPAITTKSFILGETEHHVRIIGTEDDPWFVAADIGKVLGIDKMAHHLSNYNEFSERGVEGCGLLHVAEFDHTCVWLF